MSNQLDRARSGYRGRRDRPVLARLVGILVVIVLVATATGVYLLRDVLWGMRADVREAVSTLESGDLVGLQAQLSAYRGDADFAYYFARDVKPRTVGDAIATAAGPSHDVPLDPVLDASTYELALTDLAGVLGLATHGTGDRALPASWTADFVTASTDPTALYEPQGGLFDKKGKVRDRQDVANRSHLLLLLSRGYWATPFLRTVTAGYYAYDVAAGEDAWPGADPSKDVRYAPSPNGAYLTDGIVALSAALSANPQAALWAFTELLPRTVKIEDTDHQVGAFTHFLMFEHRYPETAEGESIGAATALTALGTAVDAQARQVVEASYAQFDVADESDVDLSDGGEVEVPVLLDIDTGPTHDASVLQALAQEVTQDSDCSWNPRDYGHCIADAAKAVWRWAKRWGHTVLEVLSLATFIPPVMYVGATAAAINAGWHAIEGDYGAAGLSVAMALPGLATSRLLTGARVLEAGAAIGKGAAAAAEVTKAYTQRVLAAAKAWWPTGRVMACAAVPEGHLRLKLRDGWDRKQIKAAHQKATALNAAGDRGELVKTKVENRVTGERGKYENQTGKTIPKGQDLDHAVEKQLGGSNDISNLQPLDRSVNRSFGRQIAAQIKDLDYGAAVAGAVVCR